MSGKLNTLLLLGNVFYFRGGKLRAKENSKYLHGHHPSANDGTSIEGLHRSKRLFLHRKCDPMLPSVCQVNQTRASSKNASSSWKTNEINSKLDKKIEYEVQFSSHHTLLIRGQQWLIPSIDAKKRYYNWVCVSYFLAWNAFDSQPNIPHWPVRVFRLIDTSAQKFQQPSTDLW